MVMAGQAMLSCEPWGRARAALAGIRGVHPGPLQPGTGALHRAHLRPAQHRAHRGAHPTAMVRTQTGVCTLQPGTGLAPCTFAASAASCTQGGAPYSNGAHSDRDVHPAARHRPQRCLVHAGVCTLKQGCAPRQGRALCSEAQALALPPACRLPPSHRLKQGCAPRQGHAARHGPCTVRTCGQRSVAHALALVRQAVQDGRQHALRLVVSVIAGVSRRCAWHTPHSTPHLGSHSCPPPPSLPLTCSTGWKCDSSVTGR